MTTRTSGRHLPLLPVILLAVALMVIAFAIGFFVHPGLGPVS